MSDTVALQPYYQYLYYLLLNNAFTFTIRGRRVTAEEYMNYPISNYSDEHMSMVEKALNTRLNVSHETLRGKGYV